MGADRRVLAVLRQAEVAAGEAERDAGLDMDRRRRDGPGDLLDDRGGEPVDLLRATGREGDHAGEFVAAEAGDQRLHRQDAAHPLGAFAQDGVADAVAVEVVDLLEVVEVDHHEGDDLAALGRLGDQLVRGPADRAAVEAAGERVGLGE